MASESDIGISGALHASVPFAIIISVFLALALYNIELTYIIFMAFMRRTGLYYWNSLVASRGIVAYASCFFFKFFQILLIDMVSVTFIIIGWASMVTGKSIVLCYRLYLVIRNATKVHWVLIMIIVNTIILYILIFVLVYGSNSAKPKPFIRP